MFLLGIGIVVLERQVDRLQSQVSHFRSACEGTQRENTNRPKSRTGPNNIGSEHCWARVFGDPVEIQLLPPALLDLPLSTMVRCKLGDLMRVIEAEGEAVYDSVRFIKGTFIIVLVGQVDGIQLWHVCSFREATLAMEDPDSFVRIVREGDFYQSSTKAPAPSDPELSPQEYVFVGALVTPRSSARVSIYEFDHELAPERRGKVTRKALAELERLQFNRITYLGQISMGAQGPQGSLSVGGESCRSGEAPELKEFNMGNVQNVFGQAINQQILLFQTSTRILSEQNLFNIVVSAIIHLLPCRDIIKSVESRTSDIREVIEALFTVNSDLHRSYRALQRISTNTVFTAHLRRNLVTGIDLRTLILRDRLLVLCEEKWTSGSALQSEIGKLPCLAVHSLEPTPQLLPPIMHQATLFITVRLVEEIIGPLYLDTSQLTGTHAVFTSEKGITLELTDVTSEIIAAVRENWTIPVITWDEMATVITPGEILAGRRPAIIRIPDAIDQFKRQFPSWISVHMESQSPAMGIRLGVLVNGVEPSCCSELGVLLSCE